MITTKNNISYKVKSDGSFHEVSQMYFVCQNKQHQNDIVEQIHKITKSKDYMVTNFFHSEFEISAWLTKEDVDNLIQNKINFSEYNSLYRMGE